VLLKSLAGIRLTPVAYKGGLAIYPDLLSGRVSACFVRLRRGPRQDLLKRRRDCDRSVQAATSLWRCSFQFQGSSSAMRLAG
jgi:hypothetical protein